MKMEITSLMFFVLMAIFSLQVEGSAIPMWEFLSRDEKMSHLYRVFSRQVTNFCHDSSKSDCNKNLIISGLRQLASMDENTLDELDPYQRDSNDLIWRALVGKNKFANRVSHDSASYYTTDADPLVTSGSDHNDLGEESGQINNYVKSSEHSGPLLVGPMVIRVYPDGRPVPEDIQRPLPKDEDLEELKFPRVPSISEIQNENKKSSSSFSFKKPYNTLTRNSIIEKPYNQWSFTGKAQRINYFQNPNFIRERRFIPIRFFN